MRPALYGRAHFFYLIRVLLGSYFLLLESYTKLKVYDTIVVVG